MLRKAVWILQDNTLVHNSYVAQMDAHGFSYDILLYLSSEPNSIGFPGKGTTLMMIMIHAVLAPNLKSFTRKCKKKKESVSGHRRNV